MVVFPVTNATISRRAAEQLFGKPTEQLTVGAVGQQVSASWSYQWRPTAYPARNVIAMLPGSDPTMAQEYVLVGAHNDHVGVNTSVIDHDSLRAVNFVTRRQGNNDPSCIPTAVQQTQINALIAKARAARPAQGPRRSAAGVRCGFHPAGPRPPAPPGAAGS